MPTPADPDTGYLLDWEDTAINGSPMTPPPGWAAQYNPNPSGGMAYDRFRIEQRPWRLRTFSANPLGRSRWSGRFELRHGEPPVPGAGSVRSELSAGVQQFDDGWYGFSIFLPGEAWDVPGTADAAGEILAQWHHNGPVGSPPLAILTRNGSWYVSQHWSADPSKDNTNPDTPVGTYTTDTWTDWVVHAIWSHANGRIQVWKDGSNVFDVSGQTAYAPPETAVYMKLGIYKWAWATGAPASTNTRVVYHDELRIKGPDGDQEAVSPWPPRPWWARIARRFWP